MEIIGVTPSLLSTGVLAQPEWKGISRLMQGPMLGWIAPDQVVVWVRSSGPDTIWLEYSKDWNFAEHLKSNPISLSRQEDFTGVIRIDGLTPDTKYHYRINVGDIQRGDPYTRREAPFNFRTAPSIGAKVRFSIAFGSCARTQLRHSQTIWNAINQRSPDIFLWLGDNIYGDSIDWGVLSEEYRRLRDVPESRSLMHSVPQLAIWDDHDYGLDNQDRRHPGKETSLQIFKRYWANPSYGLPDAPGVFFEYQYGGVDLFFLDVRYYRDPNDSPDGPDKTMLGLRQKEWLKQRIVSSQAPFKFLISGTPWNEGKKFGNDSWSSYLHERNELFDFVRDNNVNGVVLLSGDTHVAELNVMPWSNCGGYDFYEFSSSPLAQATASSWLNYIPINRVRQVYAGGDNFGLMELDMSNDDPQLSYNVYNSSNEAVWKTFNLKASELRNGTSHYKNKMDDDSLRRHEAYVGGRHYYDHEQ